MRGSYNYAPAKLIVSKVVKDNSGKKEQQFLDGDYLSGASTIVVFKNGLPAGDYLINFEVEWDEVHSMRKVVLTCNSEARTPLRRLNPESYGRDRHNAMCRNLSGRLDNPKYDVDSPF